MFFIFYLLSLFLIVECSPPSSSNPDKDPCGICLDETNLSDMIDVCGHNHKFHEECINKWIAQLKTTCPICRASMDSISDPEECLIVTNAWRSMGGNVYHFQNPTQCCDQIGIICNQLGKIEGILWSYKRLSGSIDPDLGNLQYLEYLELNDNLLTDSLPSFENARSLYSLKLQNNFLTGFNQLGYPQRLMILNISSNLLCESISSFETPPNLFILDLSHNRLTGSFPISWKNPGNHLIRVSLNGNPGLSGKLPKDFVYSLRYKGWLLRKDLSINRPVIRRVSRRNHGILITI